MDVPYGGSHIAEIEENKYSSSEKQRETTGVRSEPLMASKHGDIEHHRKVLRYWLLSCASLLVLAPLVSVILGIELHARQFSYTPNPSQAQFTGRTLLMEVVLVSADPMNSIMTFDWNITGEVNTPCSNNTLDKCTDIDIFFDE